MIDKIEYLTDGDKKYPIAFTLNVMERAEEEYGGVGKWVKLMRGSEPSYKALKFMILEMINEGIDIENDKLKENQKMDFMTSKQVGRLISRIGFEESGKQIFKLINTALPKDTNPKNVVTTMSLK